MANRAEECRLRAEQCEQTAKAATNPTEQRIYAELTRQWRQMAAQAEMLGNDESKDWSDWSGWNSRGQGP
jgi:hypothetical protein